MASRRQTFVALAKSLAGLFNRYWQTANLFWAHKVGSKCRKGRDLSSEDYGNESRLHKYQDLILNLHTKFGDLKDRLNPIKKENMC